MAGRKRTRKASEDIKDEEEKLKLMKSWQNNHGKFKDEKQIKNLKKKKEVNSSLIKSSS